MKALRILIADDDETMLLSLRRILVGMGHEIAGEAHDGEEAVAVAKEKQPDLAILDIRMPKMEGIPAARLIQEHRPTPIITISGFVDPGLGSEAAGAGAHAYLVKPFTPEEINPAIEMAMANFQKAKRLSEELQRSNEALETRKLVERAKGIFMRETGYDEEAAYLKLQKTARNENKKLSDVARAIILADQLKRDKARPLPDRGAARP